MATNSAMRAWTSKCIPGGRSRGATSEPVPPVSATAIPGQGTGGSSVIALSLSTTDSTSPLPGPTSRALLQDPCTCLLEDPCLCLRDARTKSSHSHMNLLFVTLLCTLTVNKSLPRLSRCPCISAIPARTHCKGPSKPQQTLPLVYQVLLGAMILHSILIHVFWCALFGPLCRT